MSDAPELLSEADFDWVLALTRTHEEETSPLDRDKLAGMRAAAFRCTKIAPRAAFLIAFDQTSAYDSPNFLWFRERYPAFAYVDRVLVDPGARKQGHARALYGDVFAAAAAAGYPIVGCEVNLDPPNPGSDAFHERLGFAEVGRATLANGKTVRYLVRSVGAAS